MNKYSKITLSLIGFLILFFKQIRQLFEDVIIVPILSKIEPNLLIDLIFLIISFLIFRKLYLNFKNKTYISGNQLFVSLSILAFYLFIRTI